MNRKPSTSAKRRPAASRVPVTVRLPAAVVQSIDKDLHHRDVPLSRNNWLLEAAIEKLRRSAGGQNGAK